MDDINKETNTEEIDLWSLLKRMWNACVWAISKFLVYLLRKSLWLITFIVIGVIFCVIQSNTGKKYYSSTVQLRSNINSALIISQIDVLNDLIEVDKYEDLATTLHLPIEVVKEIRSIKGLYAIDTDGDGFPDYADVTEEIKKNPQDTALKKMSGFSYLQLDVYSDVVFPNVAKTLKEYIKKNEFLGRENGVIVEQRKALLKEIEMQVAVLDSFQKVEYFDKSRQTYGSQNTFMLGDRNKQLFHNDYISLYAQQQAMERDVELYSDIITIVQDFPPLSSPANPLMSYLKKYLWWFLLLGFVCVLLWDNRRFLLSNIFGKKKAA